MATAAVPLDEESVIREMVSGIQLPLCAVQTFCAGGGVVGRTGVAYLLRGIQEDSVGKAIDSEAWRASRRTYEGIFPLKNGKRPFIHFEEGR